MCLHGTGETVRARSDGSAPAGPPTPPRTPLPWPKGFRNEVQCIATVLSADLVTPYGYGGAFRTGEADARAFWRDFDAWAAEQRVVSELVRLSLFPERLLPYPGEREQRLVNVVRDLGPAGGELWMDYEHKVRKNVKKARRSGLRVEIDETGARLDDFVRLYEQGLIYRGKRLVNWDPVLGTAVSDLEVDTDEEDGKIWELLYPFADGPSGALKGLTVATTRPETMLGDTAVAVHPDDERYTHLVGKNVILPLVGRRIPIVADEYSDPEKGSGAVKITPAHDFNDFEVGKRHNLPMINVFDDFARMNGNVPPEYRGLDRFAARQ